MEQVNKCTSVLRPLIAAADPNGTILAEKALDELMAATPDLRKKVALQSVRSVVTAHRDAASGGNRSFADTVNDYIEKLTRDLE